MMPIELKSGLIITAPKGAVCGLYNGVPSSRNYFEAIKPENALAPTDVSTQEERSLYYYKDLAEGIYHYAASMDGYTAVCQIIHYTKEKAASCTQIDIAMSALAGNGFESGFVMLNSAEFIEANLASEQTTWGEKYAHLFETPQFTRSESRPGKHQQTTNEEIYDFIGKLKKSNKNMHVFSLGKSPKYGFDMPLVLFTREDVSGLTLEQAAQIIRNNGKPTVQYVAQVHSNEPASTEGALAMMLSLSGEFGDRVLGKADVYIIPRINLDGAVEVIRDAPTTGEDMNRDYLYMNNKEIRMVVSAYNLFLPELAIDGHEKLTHVLVTETARCNDMELQTGAGALNHPAIMTETAMKIALEAIHKGRDLGLRTHFYQEFASAAGGSAGSSYFGTRNSISFLVETPGGTTLGNFCMARRVMAQYVLASTVISYAAEHADEILHIVRSSREKMIEQGRTYREDCLMVLEHDKTQTGSLPAPVIDVPSGKMTEIETSYYTEHTVALRSRPRPTAYILSKGIENEQRILELLACHGIGYQSLPGGSIVPLRQYVKAEDGIDVSSETDVCFENGAYVFLNTVPSTVLSVIMEPDFNRVSKRRMSLYSMELVDFDEGGKLPIYRYCHDLSDDGIEWR